MWFVGQFELEQLNENVLHDADLEMDLRRNGFFVFQIDDDGIAQQVAVELGDSAGDLIVVSSDLEEGDRVAIRGAENLRDGMATKTSRLEPGPENCLIRPIRIRRFSPARCIL